MAVQNQRKKKGRAQAVQKKKRRLPLLVVILAGVCLVLAALVGVFTEKKSGVESSTHQADHKSVDSKNTSANKQRDLLKLVGRWIRTDGGYVIEIRNVDIEDKMEAFYYNPRPINVSVAKAHWSGSGTKVFIELQDAGYPGSTYTLDYDPGNDALTGSYFQAVVKQEFDVVFVRMK
jgi:hypothetical protein